MRREVAAAHTRQAAAFQAAATFSSSAADCAPAAELEQTLDQLLALETAGQGNDYAARAAGGKVGRFILVRLNFRVGLEGVLCPTGCQAA